MVFWDQDNAYEPDALWTLWKGVEETDDGKGTSDMVVARTMYRHRTNAGAHLIPKKWNGAFKLGDIDTMCVMVKREFALKARWDACPDGIIYNDYEWFKALEKHGPKITYVNKMIGWHL